MTTKNRNPGGDGVAGRGRMEMEKVRPSLAKIPPGDQPPPATAYRGAALVDAQGRTYAALWFTRAGIVVSHPRRRR